MGVGFCNQSDSWEVPNKVITCLCNVVAKVVLIPLDNEWAIPLGKGHSVTNMLNARWCVPTLCSM